MDEAGNSSCQFSAAKSTQPCDLDYKRNYRRIQRKGQAGFRGGIARPQNAPTDLQILVFCKTKISKKSSFLHQTIRAISSGLVLQPQLLSEHSCVCQSLVDGLQTLMRLTQQ
ncbi:hypothetical protein EOD39_11939 [Acipenser ruthenus]|uniref:Uncharacterized protein n=1 Tax=Acipenser ruthenus TaxID=7906 RepID=A0A444UML3_ACIRT|nr:hypothetical protein EOD39_11939 [Acipenser ruthenus]